MPPERQREADFHYMLGISHLNEGNIQIAYVQLQKALQINPEGKEILNALGLVYLQLEEYGKAKELFKRVLAIDPEFSDAHHHLGIAYMSDEKWNEAVVSFKRALANPLYQTPERSFYLLAMAYYRTGQFALAINSFKDSIKRQPLFPLPFYGLAIAYNKAGRYGDASAAIARAIEIDPQYRGSRTKFVDEIKQRLFTAKGYEEADLRDYLEIMNY